MTEFKKIVACALLIFLTSPVFPQIQRIDHFVLNTPESAELIERFTEVFGLPLAWRSGDNAGISLGNVVLECSNYASGDYTIGIGLEPAQEALAFIPMLDEAGVPHEEADPHYMQGEDGSEFLAYTLVDLNGMLPDPEVYLFVVDYASREYMSGVQRGAAGELAAADGGLLGVEKLEEIIIATRQHLDFSGRMKKLPGVESRGEGIFYLNEGPAIRLEDGEEDNFVLVIKVKSLENAAMGLKDANIPMEQTGRRILITELLPSGVQIMLTE